MKRNAAANARKIGKKGERVAARYLKKAGFRIVARNCRVRKDELDIVAKNRSYIVFAEVKTRTVDAVSFENRPVLAVDAGKRARMIRAARQFLSEYYTNLCPRFDVIEIYLDDSFFHRVLKVHHIPAAFDKKGEPIL